MITPSQIREKKISTVESGGYDRDEVNELLLEIIESYEAVYNENRELYRKMEVLANRIEEYRADEDSIKTALITAQKMADQLKRDAKEKAEKSLAESAASAQQTVVDAKEKADKIIGEAREYVAGLTKEKAEAADEIVLEARKKANEAIDSAKIVAGNTLSQAKKLASEIVSKAKAEKECQAEIASKLKDESKDFKSALVSLYETQLDKLRDMVKEPDSFSSEDEGVDELEKELNTLMNNIAEVIGDDADAEESNEPDEEQEINEASEPEQTETAEVINDTAETEKDEEPEVEEFAEESSSDEQEEDADDREYDDIIDEVDEIIDELDTANTYSPLHEAEEEPVSEEEVSNAIDAFSTDEITPIDDSVRSIPVIEDEPEFESAMPFESYFNVKKETERTNETISLIPPDDDEDEEEDGSRFKGFFKKKK